MSNPLHFTSGNYTVIKTSQGQYSFLGTGKAEMLDHMRNIDDAIRHGHRQIAALTLFLNGKSESSPEALHI